MSRSAAKADIAAWTKQAAEAEAARADNPAAMDIYEARVPKSKALPAEHPIDC